MQLVKEKISDVDQIQLTVETFGRWALWLVGSRTLIENDDANHHVCQLLKKIGVNNTDLDYFIDEVNYVMGRFLPARRGEYVHTRRSGRGRIPAVPRAMRVKLLSEVIEPYEYYKSSNNNVDWHDIALEAATVEQQGYDVVVVDEAQDLSANQLRAILAHLDKYHVTTFIMDAVQRIYPQNFLWQEIDINMRSHMVNNLTRNCRNTKEIARFASSLVQDLELDENGVLPNAEACQRSGQRPQVVAGSYSEQLDYMLNFIHPFLDDVDQTVAILHPKGGRWFDFTRKMLQRRNIGYCEIAQNRNWPTGQEQVALSTIHSAKGLEFDHVLLPGLNQEVTPHGNQDGHGMLDALRRLVAMGIGRARETVMIGYKPGEQSTLIRLLDPETYDTKVL